jgi:hypothetical protein
MVLFNDAAFSLDCIASDGIIISQYWIAKDVEGSFLGLKYYPGIFMLY